MDYNFFDGLIDSVFVVDADRKVVYCNESAAKLCESSIRRMAGGKFIYQFIEFSDKSLFVMPNGTSGEVDATPYQEIEFNLRANSKKGKVQVAIQPFLEPSGEKRWAVMIRDVTIEEVLHAKYHKQLEQLEQYSKNLEHMVEERTREVKSANVMLNAIMNSLGQGFFSFDSSGVCSKFFTKACLEILEAQPADKMIWDLLKLPPNEKATFEMWMKAVFSETLPFDSLKELGPSTFHHSQGRHIKLEYFPIRDDSQKVSNIVVVATDKTSEFLANQALDREKRFAKMVVKLVTSKRQFASFISSARQTIDDLIGHARDNKKIDIEWMYRALHTLEGEAATYSAQELWAGSRACQEALAPFRKAADATVNAKIPELQNSLHKLKEQYNHFLKVNNDIFKSLGVLDGEPRIEMTKQDALALLAKLQKAGVTPPLFRSISDQLLKEPIGPLLNHFDDVVQSLADKLGKRMAPIKILNGEYRIVAEPYKKLLSSLIHVVRNSIDHGIEPAEEREMAGKSPLGHIEFCIEAFKNNNQPWFRIRISDDGEGISADRIRQKWQKQNPSESASDFSDEEAIQLIFSPGFSTREDVGEFSGRGVGMNVVKVEAEALGGRAWVESEVGGGTTTFIEIPDISTADEHKLAA